MTAKRKIKLMMNDAIDEAFILTAIEKYCHEVLADETDWGDRSLINKDLWQCIARLNLATMENTK
jgi:hypothetical protein